MNYNIDIYKAMFLLGFSFSLFAQPVSEPELTTEDAQILEELDESWFDTLNSTSLFSNYKGANGELITNVSEEVLRYRLEEMNNATPFDLQYNKVVHAYVEKYLKAGKYYGKIMGLAEYYFPLFEEKLSKYEIPLEIKYLAIVESALRPTVGSHAGAKGLWQFMYGTGKMYGLKVNSYIDERYDPIKSTDAACKMLKELHRYFGDWNLALAAYNYGPGNINKAVRRSGGQKNYWKLRKYLPKETQGYVPKFIAVNYIMHYYKEHNIEPRRLETRFFNTDTIAVKQKMTFNQINDFLNIDREELEFLNPVYKLGVVPESSTKKYYLRLPIEKVNEYAQKEQFIAAIIDAEKIMSRRKKPSAKEKIDTTSVMKKKSTPKKKSKAKKVTVHKVVIGDNLITIGKHYKVSVANLKRWNNLKSNSLKIGQKLKLYETKVKLKSSKKYHTVKRGDSLIRIAKKYRTTVPKIKKINKMRSNNLRVGQKLRIQ